MSTEKLTDREMELYNKILSGVEVYKYVYLETTVTLRTDTTEDCTEEVQGLVKAGLLELFDVNISGCRYRISRKGF